MFKFILRNKIKPLSRVPTYIGLFKVVILSRLVLDSMCHLLLCLLPSPLDSGVDGEHDDQQQQAVEHAENRRAALIGGLGGS